MKWEKKRGVISLRKENREKLGGRGLEVKAIE